MYVSLCWWKYFCIIVDTALNIPKTAQADIAEISQGDITDMSGDRSDDGYEENHGEASSSLISNWEVQVNFTFPIQMGK